MCFISCLCFWETDTEAHSQTQTHRGSINPPELKQLNEELSSAVWLILLREEHRRLTVCQKKEIKSPKKIQQSPTKSLDLIF